MKKNKTYKDLLYISISFFVIVAFWVGFSIYDSYVTSTVTPEVQEQIEPIAPAFDTTTLQQLGNRRKVAPQYELNNASSEAELSPSPVAQFPSNTPVASASSGLPERLGQ